MTKYELPELPYDYAALEPHISGKIMELHHDKHHQAYVSGANAALEKLAEAREKNDFAQINLWEKNLSFNLGGHYNHSVFWTNLSPEGGEAEGDLLEQIQADFGSVDALKAQFTAAALGIQGSGWAVLAWDTLGGRLITYQMYDQANQLPVAVIPVLMLDMWEHAFYLDYQNVKGDYVKAFWHIVSWANVADRLKKAKENYSGIIA
ncbi:MAG: superoxide dismutase [Actinomycetaceae bacterium]|nr:superoxide dismutase [Actinomycetaceae bacterium]